MENGLKKDKGTGRRKRRMERLLVGATVLVIIGLTVLQTYVVRAGAGAPKVNSILVFALINFNAIIIFFLLFLVLRNLYQIFFEPRRKVLGARLRTKLVVAFVSLSLVPTALLFFVAIQFITSSQDYWFNTNVEQSLIDSLDLGQSFASVTNKMAEHFSGQLSHEIEQSGLYQTSRLERLKTLLDDKRKEYGFSLVEYYAADQKLQASFLVPELEYLFIPSVQPSLFRDVTINKRVRTWVSEGGHFDMVRSASPVSDKNGAVAGVLVAGYYFDPPFNERLEAVGRGLEGFRQLQRLKDPIKVSHYITLTIVALLIVFVSTWIGFHLAKGLTGPLTDLAEGTQRVAMGDYDFTIEAQSSDEMGVLVESFNQMNRDLKTSKEALTQKNQELLGSYTELDQRRRYTEIILQNVAAGVISADREGRITTINNSAAEILQINVGRVIGQPYRTVTALEHMALLDDLIQAAQRSARGSAESQVRIKIRDHILSLHVHLTLLTDESGQDLGLVIVFDDLSELEKAQRMAAWREVARRIAHEIKNPLTPIQLSAQRLRKRFGDRFGEDSQVFDEATEMIIRQVEELKKLVNEFSNFARMPAANPTPNDLGRIVEETLFLYREAHREIEFVFNREPGLPVFDLDKEQMKRVLINLLDNAVAALENHGRIEISLHYDDQLKMARLELADNGPGISPADKARLFEPYFSTKKSGTGLGLAIVSTIVSDHNGFVRVQDNDGGGAVFIIELPVRN